MAKAGTSKGASDNYSSTPAHGRSVSSGKNDPDNNRFDNLGATGKEKVKYDGQFSSEYGREHYIETHGFGKDQNSSTGTKDTGTKDFEQGYGDRTGKDYDRENYGAKSEAVKKKP